MFFVIFHSHNHRFLPNFCKSYSKMQNVDNKFILHTRSIAVLVWRQMFVVKGCFFSYHKIRHFYMESIVYPFVNILEGSDNYFSLTKYYHTDFLYLIENSGFTHLQNIFFFLFLLLYVDCTHFLPYVTLMVNKHLYETS